ncbi:MAG: HAD family hydrolase [Bacteroidota bacterium]
MLSHNIRERYITPLKPIPTAMLKSGEILAGIECVLFDIYGTLFISGAGDIGLTGNQTKYIEKIDQLLHRFGINTDPQALINGLRHAISRAHREQEQKGIAFPEVEIDHIWMSVLDSNDVENIRAFAVEYELIVNPVYPMPHLQDLLAACSRKKIRMGLISNAQFYTLYMFKWFLAAEPEHIGFHPDLILLSYRFGYAKPSLDLFQIAAERLQKMNVPGQAVLFVGNDMLNDIYPAKQTGFKTALFAGDKRSLRLRQDDPRCRNLSADLVVTDLMQLFDYIP